MGYVDNGISSLQKVGIRNVEGYTPNYLYFAGSDNTFTGSETYAKNVFIEKPITWVQSGNNSKYTAQLSSIDAVGSNILAAGLVGSDATGSSLCSLDESYIGQKTSAFNVEMEGEIIIRRPVI